jgi:O-antigen/teichoic acid export membrane protein
MTTAERSRYSLVMRNAGLNLAGRVVLALAALAIIPLLIRGLGLERYGILSLALVTVSYFSLLDCGLGVATTKFVAAALGQGENHRLPALIWTSLLLLALLGTLAGLLMLLSAPWLVERLLHISPALRGEVKAALSLLSALAPFLLLSAGLQGVVEARQRYDLVNAVAIPASLTAYLAPALAMGLHWGLVPIAALLVATRAAACGLFFLLCRRLYPELRGGIHISLRSNRPLLSFGGWLAVSNLVWPVLLYCDRLVIGALLPLAVLPFYAAPCELVTRLWALPASWVALFPAFSALAGRRQELARLSARGLKHLALLLVPAVMVAICFAGSILRFWLGAEFAAASTTVFQVLGLGVLANSLATVPDRLIKAMGRSDLIAKLHLAELPLYLGLLYLLVLHLGITGAALAWTARALVEAAIVFGLSGRMLPGSGREMIRAGISRLAWALAALAGALAVTASVFTGGARLAAAGLLLALAAGLGWRRILDQNDRDSLRAAVSAARAAS